MYRDRRVGAIVLARTGSRRLPEKMLLPFRGTTVLGAAVARLSASTCIDQVVLATTALPADDELARHARELGLRVVRGSEDDVVARMRDALAAFDAEPDVVVRACADNPLVMPTIVDDGVRELVDGAADLITPFEHATLPFGFGLVAMTTACLLRIDADARDAGYREHVENFCFEHPERFRIRYQVAPAELCWPELCLSLDHASDLERLRRLADRLVGVRLEEQPFTLIESLRTARVWIQGRSDGSPDEADLAIVHDPLAADAAPRGCPLGVVRVATARVLGRERFVLEYVDPVAGFPSEPLFVDRRVRRPDDTPRRFLDHALPLALPHLLAAPARAAREREAPVATGKAVRASRRRGFAEPEHATFPARIELHLPADGSRPRWLGQLLDEVEAAPHARLYVPEVREDDELGGELRARLGPGRVLGRAAELDPFTGVRVEATGELGVAGLRSDLRGDSVTGFWLSPALRRSRSTALNRMIDREAS